MAQALPFEFKGFYAGAHAGYVDAEADFSGGGDLSDNGLMGGLQAGYNFLNGNFIWGVEVDISLTSAAPDGACPGGLGLICEVDIGPMVTLRPRVGYARDNYLLYLTGGVAGAEIDVDATTAGGASAGNTDGGAFGWTAGAGLEYLMGDIVGVKLEYRYLQFGDFDDITVPSGTDVDVNMHVIMGGLNYHF